MALNAPLSTDQDRSAGIASACQYERKEWSGAQLLSGCTIRKLRDKIRLREHQEGQSPLAQNCKVGSVDRSMPCAINPAHVKKNFACPKMSEPDSYTLDAQPALSFSFFPIAFFTARKDLRDIFPRGSISRSIPSILFLRRIPRVKVSYDI